MPSPRLHSSLADGTIVGDYELESLCHQGQGAAIYLAKHLRLPRRVAIKVVPEHLEASSTAAARFRQIAGQISSIRHAHVAELYDYGLLDDGRPYLVLEWIEGVALGTQGGAPLPQSAGQTIALLKSIASGLVEIHAAKLSHGGVSPANLMIESEGGKAKLVGFNLSAVLRADAASEEAAPDVQGDIEDLGALIRYSFGDDFEQATVRHASPGQATDETARAAVPAEVAEAIAVIAERCDVQSRRRYSSVSSIVSDLDRAQKLAREGDDALPVGTLLGETYRVTALIGNGGMGKVYEAMHVRLPQRVAIKVISGSFTEESLIRFRREAEIASSLGHPHIVRVFDFNTTADGKPYMVMEYLQGEDLGKVLRRGALEPERALRIADQIGSALSVAHENGIVHRDLKPPNLYLRKVEIGGEEREHATVLDFGVSKREGSGTSVTRTQAVVGTPQYMAPEQAMGHNDEVTAQSDQFALGCIVYEMLAGRPAFGKGELAEVVYRVCHQDAPALDLYAKGLSPATVAAVARAMSKRAADRFDSVADFVAALSGRSGDSRSTSAESGLADASSSPVANTLPQGTSETIANGPRRKKWKSGKQGAAPLASGRKVVVVVGALAAGLLVAALLVVSGSWGQDESKDLAGDPVRELVPALDTHAVVPLPDAARNEAKDPSRDAAASVQPGDAGSALASPKSVARPAVASKELGATLQRAQKLLDKGEYAAVRSLLSRDKEAAKSPQAKAMMVMSYCGESRFGAAADWLSRVPATDRERVRRYCRSEHEIELD